MYQPDETFAEVSRETDRGDFARVLKLQGLARAALTSKEYLAGLRVSPLHLSELEEFVRIASPSWAAHELFFAGRAAWLACDLATLERISQLLASLDTPTQESTVRSEVLSLWLALLTGVPTAEMHARASELEQIALSMRAGTLVIEIAALRALLFLETSNLAEAVREARRASRMARTEDFPQEEYVANLVLARVRRASGSPHLAMRILVALEPRVPPAWQPWVHWERAIASGEVRATDESLAVLDSLLAAARDGKRERFVEATRRLRAASSRIPFRSRDAERVIAVLDPDCESPVDQEILSWKRGEVGLPPWGLSGLSGYDDEDVSRDGTSITIHRPERIPTRVLHLARRLAIPDEAYLAPARARPGRIDTLLCVLILGGPEGLSEAQTFEAVYGFTFVRAKHDGTFRVLLHRTRAHLPSGFEIQRADGRIALHAPRPLALVDPRSEPERNELVLRALARQSGTTAREAAQMLDIPIRTVQAILEGLAAEGRIECKRGAGRIEYLVEDTTFREPTQSTAG